MLQIDPASLSREEAYKLLITIIVPRPIAWVSSVSRAGHRNLAPFSFFNGVSSHPPVISLSIGLRPDGSLKDTLANILETGEFVVNMVTEGLAEPMHQSSAGYPAEVDEFAQVGVTPLPCAKVRPPRVAESPISLECALLHELELPGVSGRVVFGRVLQYHIAEPLLTEGTVDIESYPVVGRLGGLGYCLIDSTFSLPRPSVPAHLLE